MDILFSKEKNDKIANLSDEEYLNSLTIDTKRLLQNIIKLVGATKMLQKKLELQELKHKSELNMLQMEYEDKIAQLKYDYEERIKS